MGWNVSLHLINNKFIESNCISCNLAIDWAPETIKARDGDKKYDILLKIFAEIAKVLNKENSEIDIVTVIINNEKRRIECVDGTTLARVTDLYVRLWSNE